MKRFETIERIALHHSVCIAFIFFSRGNCRQGSAALKTLHLNFQESVFKFALGVHFLARRLVRDRLSSFISWLYHHVKPKIKSTKRTRERTQHQLAAKPPTNANNRGSTGQINTQTNVVEDAYRRAPMFHRLPATLSFPRRKNSTQRHLGRSVPTYGYASCQPRRGIRASLQISREEIPIPSAHPFCSLPCRE